MWCGIPAHQGPVSVESSPEVEQSCGKRVTSLVHGGLLLSVLLGLFCGSGALALSFVSSVSSEPIEETAGPLYQA